MRLLLLVFLPAVLCAPSTLPVVDISSLFPSTQVHSSLQHLGALAITGLGPEYSSAIRHLEHYSPSCLHHAPVSRLSDGSYRSTLATSSLDPVAFPTCVREAVAAIIDTYDAVDIKLSAVLTAIIGNEGWEDRSTGESGHVQSLPTKTHLHVYHAGNYSGDNHLSWPWHLDNGLYLLVTPSSRLPLILQTSDGGVVSSAGLPDDTVLLLVGRGLSEWMLQGKEGIMRAVPHAVPSLGPVGVKTRTVLARMKVAPESAVPTVSGASLTFGSVFSQLLPTRDTLTPSKTDLNWVESHEKMCEQGYGYCWMGCRPMPKGCGDETLAVCTTSCGGQCCTDTITNNCDAHGSTCQNKCPTFKCPSNGLHPDPSSPCSVKFYNCDHGIAHEETCDPGLVFNPYVLMCDWPDSPQMASQCCWTSSV